MEDTAPSTSLDNRGLFQAFLGDGRPLLLFTGLSLVLSGGFALFLSIAGHFLPHDIAFLGMTPDQLCAINNCRIVLFMFHDRVAFGGAIMAIGLLYLWLTEFPLRRSEVWSWWVLALSGISGFGSFLAYLGYGYLDTWHGIATLILLPCFLAGMIRSFTLLPATRHIRVLFRPGVPVGWYSAFGIGRVCLLGTTLGLVVAGVTILVVGMTDVFVPQDLEFIGLHTPELAAISPRLIPLIAHDRAGFGGAICTTGITMFFCLWCGQPSRNLWQVVACAGGLGFATAIGVHLVVGYTDLVHLAPALVGGVVFTVGLGASYKAMMVHSRHHARASSPALQSGEPSNVQSEAHEAG